MQATTCSLDKCHTFAENAGKKNCSIGARMKRPLVWVQGTASTLKSVPDEKFQAVTDVISERVPQHLESRQVTPYPIPVAYLLIRQQDLARGNQTVVLDLHTSELLLVSLQEGNVEVQSIKYWRNYYFQDARFRMRGYFDCDLRIRKTRKEWACTCNLIVRKWHLHYSKPDIW